MTTTGPVGRTGLVLKGTAWKRQKLDPLRNGAATERPAASTMLLPGVIWHLWPARVVPQHFMRAVDALDQYCLSECTARECVCQEMHDASCMRQLQLQGRWSCESLFLARSGYSFVNIFTASRTDIPRARACRLPLTVVPNQRNHVNSLFKSARHQWGHVDSYEQTGLGIQGPYRIA